MKEELNVHTVEFTKDTTAFMDAVIKPNYAVLGPKYKQQAQQIGQLLETMDQTSLHQQLIKDNKIILTKGKQTYTLTKEDILIEEKVKAHLAKADVGSMVLLLDTTMTPEQEAEGLAREIVRRIQSMRKELDLNLEAHINTQISIHKEHQQQLEPWEAYIKEETRTDTIHYTTQPKGALEKTWSIDTLSVTIAITP
jgi:isoleucyl-tRNA synthetase